MCMKFYFASWLLSFQVPVGSLWRTCPFTEYNPLCKTLPAKRPSCNQYGPLIWNLLRSGPDQFFHACHFTTQNHPSKSRFGFWVPSKGNRGLTDKILSFESLGCSILAYNWKLRAYNWASLRTQSSWVVGLQMDFLPTFEAFLGTHSRTLALKTENFSKRLRRSSQT